MQSLCSESRGIDDQQDTKTCYSNAQSKSVLMNNIENTKDTYLGKLNIIIKFYFFFLSLGY